MALRKRPIEKKREAPKSKNVFSKPKRSFIKEKPFYKGESKRTYSGFDKSINKSDSIKGEKKTINRFKKKDLSESNSTSFSNIRKPFKKANKFSNTDKEIKVYSSDKGKKTENKFKNKAIEKSSVKRFSSGDSERKTFEGKRAYTQKDFTSKKQIPYNRSPKLIDSKATRFQKEDRLNDKRLKSDAQKSSRTNETKKASRQMQNDEVVRLNRYISNAGICSRREADKLISTGLVSVNGEVITEMGYQVKNSDDVRFNGQRLSREKRVYIIMNKPKDAIATLDDPDGRKTIMDLLGNEVKERVFPVGRLDRNTTGVIILTNDGELAQRLMHPKYEVEKVYKATLNKIFKGEDFWQLTNGVELEDGFIKPDELAYPDPKSKMEVGILIHSGRNRIIHRMFEHLGYLLDKLDRVSYGGFVKAGLKRGEWRHLSDKEVTQLKKLSKLGSKAIH